MSLPQGFFEDDATATSWLLSLMAATEDLYVQSAGHVDCATKLRDELGIDSIGLISVFYAVMDHFGQDLDESAAAQWATVGDVVAFARQCARQ